MRLRLFRERAEDNLRNIVRFGDSIIFEGNPYPKLHYVPRRLRLFAAWHLCERLGGLPDWVVRRSKEGRAV